MRKFLGAFAVGAWLFLAAGTSFAQYYDDAVDPGEAAGDEGGSSDIVSPGGLESGNSGTSQGSGTAEGGTTGTAGSGSQPAAGADEGDGGDTGSIGGAKGELATAIGEMTRLLQARQYDVMLDRYLYPAEKAEILKRVTLQQLAESFGRGKADVLLRLLRGLRSRTPAYTSDGQQATFVVESVENGVRVRDEVKFRKHEGRWYLKN